MIKDRLLSYPLFKREDIVSVEPLETQGFCNENFRVKTTNQTYLLRKFILHNDRRREFRIQKAASHKKIAAKPLLLDEAAGLMLCEFIEGVHRVSLSRGDLRRLAQVLRKLHALPHRTPRVPIEKSLKLSSRKIRRALMQIQREPIQRVLCHNDLNPKNILFRENGTIQLIDWEYAQCNDCYFDLAAVCTEYALSKKEERQFLGDYFQKRGAYSYQKLSSYKVVYSALCQQWFEAMEITPP